MKIIKTKITMKGHTYMDTILIGTSNDVIGRDNQWIDMSTLCIDHFVLFKTFHVPYLYVKQIVEDNIKINKEKGKKWMIYLYSHLVFYGTMGVLCFIVFGKLFFCVCSLWGFRGRISTNYVEFYAGLIISILFK